MNSYEKIKTLRIQRKMSQETLAKLTGYSDRSTIAKIEKGKIDLSENKIIIFAQALGTTPAYLMGWIEEDNSKETNALKIPVLGNVAAGIPISAVEDILDYEEVPISWKNQGEFFALRIKGDSMQPKIDDGDVVIVRQQSDANSGDTVIALVNGDDATCKKLEKTDNGIMLVSTNSKYPPMFFTKEDIVTKPVVILGKVVELRSKF
jgi:hypothetical protein